MPATAPSRQAKDQAASADRESRRAKAAARLLQSRSCGNGRANDLVERSMRGREIAIAEDVTFTPLDDRRDRAKAALAHDFVVERVARELQKSRRPPQRQNFNRSAGLELGKDNCPDRRRFTRPAHALRGNPKVRDIPFARLWKDRTDERAGVKRAHDGDRFVFE